MKASILVVWLVVACGGGDGTTELVVQTVSEYGGAPISGVAVQVDDGAWFTTDATGTAHVPMHPRPRPHDVRIHQTSSGTAPSGKPFELHDVWSLLHATDDPLLIPVDGSTAPTQHRVTISGTVTSATQTVLVSARSDAYEGSTQAVMAADGTFTLTDVTWEGDASQAVTVEAIEVESGDPPTHYRSYGKLSVTAIDGVPLGGLALSLAPVAEDHVRGTVTRPPEDTSEVRPFLSLAFGDGSWIPVNTGASSSPPGAFDFVFPVIPGASPRILWQVPGVAGGTSSAERTLTLPANDISFKPPRTALPDSPQDGNTFGPGTVFDWAEAEGLGTYAMTLGCDWTTADGALHDVNFRIIEGVGATASVPAIPDLNIPSGTACTWSVGWFDGDADGLETTAHPDSRRFSYSPERTVHFE